MDGSAITVLLIEDDPADARLAREHLAEAGQAAPRVEVADTLQAGLARAQAGGIDVILLDLNLPDSRGLRTFLRVYGQVPHIPIVVLTGFNDLTLARTALRHGAQDYIGKEKVERESLLRAIWFAVERHHRLQMYDGRQAEAERAAAPAGAAPPAAGVSAPAPVPGARSLRLAEPDTFDELTRRYAKLIEAGVRQRRFRVVQEISRELHGLAVYMCLSGAHPTEAEEIHVAALEVLAGDLPPGELQLWADEALLLLMELQRYLAGCYRDAALQ